MPRTTPLTSITQIDRPAICQQLTRAARHGAYLRIEHQRRTATLCYPDPDLDRELCYASCTNEIDALEAAAYSIGSRVIETGQRPIARQIPQPAMPNPTTEPVDDARWLTSSEVCDLYPHVPRNKMSAILGYWKQTMKVAADGSGVGSRIRFDQAARELADAYAARQAESLDTAPAIKAPIKAAIKAEPEGDALPADVEVTPTRSPEVDESKERILSEPKTAAEWLTVPAAVDTPTPTPTPDVGEAAADESISDVTANDTVSGTESGTEKRAGFEIEESHIYSVEAMEVCLRRVGRGWSIYALNSVIQDAAQARVYAALLTRAADEAERLNAEAA